MTTEIQPIKQEQSDVVKFSVTESAINQMKLDYGTLQIIGLQDKEGYKIVYDSRQVVKRKRVEIDKAEKAMIKNLDARYDIERKKITDEAERIRKPLKELETHLQAEEDKYEELVEAEKRRKEEERRRIITDRAHLLMGYQQYGLEFDGLKYSIPLDVVMPEDPEALSISYEELGKISDNEFGEFLVQVIDRVEVIKQQQKWAQPIWDNTQVEKIPTALHVEKPNVYFDQSNPSEIAKGSKKFHDHVTPAGATLEEIAAGLIHEIESCDYADRNGNQLKHNVYFKLLRDKLSKQ